MLKDPSFLFYSKDWLEGTAELTHQEKGVYIDLLAHQHQKGSLPGDTKRLARIVGLSESDFLIIWDGIKSKFCKLSDNRLVNQKLSGVMTERATKSHTNKITGKFATLIRSIKQLPRDIVETLKKEFKITDFEHLPTEEATERLSEWFYSRLQSIENANANTIVFKGGVGENEGMCYDIEKFLLEHQKDFEIVCMNSKKEVNEVKDVLHRYHLWQIKEGSYPKKPLQLIAGLQLWLLNPKNYKNGIYQQPSSTVGKTIEFDKP